MYTEICANCGDWEKCKAAGALPNDYCGKYYSCMDLSDVHSVEEYCRKWKKEYHFCNGCRYSTENNDCKVFDAVFTCFAVREEENNG